MAVYVVNHKVNDFNQWKKAYDAFETTRQKYGVKEHFVLQSTVDANHVVVVGEGELEVLNKFLNSEELKNAMTKAGIAGPADIFVGQNKL